MRLLLKILRKLAIFACMVALMGYVAKHGYRFAMQAAGVPQVSSEESDLMSTVFDSATRLVSGSAKKEDLAKELSDKLYAGRASPQEMAELGIELRQSGANPSASTAPGTAPVAAATPSAKTAAGAPKTAGGPPSLEDLKKKVPLTLLGKLREKLGMDGIVMALLPAAFLSVIAARKFRRKPSKLDDFAPLMVAMQNTGDSETYVMQCAAHTLGGEDFELLVALIYQRQGYRVSMPEGQSGGRGGDFTLARKAERLLVQCKKLANEHRVAVERVREFHEAMVTSGFIKGLYVASCGYSWDARHFAKTKGITLINGKTLDQLITAARENPDEDLLSVAQWAPKFLQKITLTPALCPTCDASMDEIVANGQTVWVCSQRPDCKGRRNARKRRKAVAGAAAAPPPAAESKTNPAASQPAAAPTRAKPPSEARTPTPAPARPPSSRRANLPRIVSKRVRARLPEPRSVLSAPPAPESAPPPEAATPAPESAPEGEQQWPPASLKSVVPRQRPIVRKSRPGPTAFNYRGHSPASDMEGKALPKAPANPPQPSTGGGQSRGAAGASKPR